LKKRLLYILFLLVIAPFCLEGAVRIMGYKAFTYHPFSISSTPKNCLIASNDLGFALETGTFEVTINEKHSYTATHVDGRRISSSDPVDDSLPTIFTMGCSYTYGMGLNDDKSFSYIIQEELTSYRIQNFGVPGFGTVQALLQLEQAIKDGQIPKMAIINYCAFHDERNILSPQYRQHLNIGFTGSSEVAKEAMKKARFPFWEEDEIHYEIGTELYTNWMGRETFATINYLQNKSDKSVHKKLKPRAATLTIFMKIKELCDKHGIELLVTSLEQTSKASSILEELKSKGFATLDMSLDLTLHEYTNFPYDSHPNVKAHTHYAQELLKHLEAR
jgi:hypothetical protein